ncbi:MAG TPA: AAA family ATPase [Patescibacteria group bacterium]|nr:AAA family ATPase [Patescibacteria group bacterium]
MLVPTPSAKDTPLLVLVSGAPGSGKSTLARRLAEHMRLPHIERDLVFWGMRYTADGVIDQSKEGISAYYATITGMLRCGISVVTDGTMYRGISEEDVREQLVPIARVVNVHCRATGEHERFYAREMNRRGGPPDWLEDYMPKLKKIYPDTAEPLDLGCPLIEVDTTNEYAPTLDDIAAQLEDRNNKVRKGHPYATKTSN